MFDVRQNEEAPCTLEKTADGETWEPWANLQLCPPKIKAVAGRLFLSTDGGTTWDPVDDTTYEEYDWRQDEPLRPARTGDDKRCLAAANAVAVFVELHREIVAWYESQGTLLQIGIAVSAVIAIMFPAGWPVVAGGLLTGAGAAVLQWTQALTNAAFTQQIQDQLRCIFWTWADENGRWTETAFAGVLADVEGKSGDIWRLLEIYLEQIGGYTGLNNAGTTTSVATADCEDCLGTWCYEFLFAADDGEFVITHGKWTPGTGYQNAGAGAAEACYAARTFSQTTITHVEVQFSAAANYESWQGAVLSSDSVELHRNNAIANVGGTLSWDGNRSATSVSWAINVDNNPLGSITVTRLLVRGNGINPFGTDNCT